MAKDIEQFLKTLLAEVVKPFTFYPQDLKISTARFKKIISIQWQANKADTSRLIGSGGETYRALAAYFKLVGEQHGYVVELERLLDPVVGKVERYEPFKANPNWPKAEIVALLTNAALSGSRHGVAEVAAQDIGQKTALVVNVVKNESAETEAALQATLGHIFKVIGNATGRVLVIDVNRTLEPEAAQPATAAGRYAGESKD
jgi:predicted RNA-binding protein YlqC (UPF0109 family)